MPEYAEKSVFIHTDEGRQFLANLQQNRHGVTIHSVSYRELQKNPHAVFNSTDHVILSGSMGFIKEMLHHATAHEVVVGLIPLPGQKNILRLLSLPMDLAGQIELALRRDARAMDLILCNDRVMLFKASVGRIPLIDRQASANRLQDLWHSIRMLRSLRLLPMTIIAAGENQTEVRTAACGCMLIQHHKRSLASRLIAHDSSIADGMISLIMVAPISVIGYGKFVVNTLTRSEEDKTLPASVGYIKSPEITIETETPLEVSIDGEAETVTPLRCRVLPQAVRLNIGEDLFAGADRGRAGERINVEALPAGREVPRASKRKVPFFTYASEERFRDLFTALRNDARLNSIYFVLMMLSTILATTGLYLNSSSVIIGAMLLAPLMAPIVALSMGLLRQDEMLITHSIRKIILGVILALLIAALMPLYVTHKPVTGEMEARLNPTVLDLIVAIVAGIAGAYTKSHKEILESLAGVAIAVALVPPLAVAGIGLGRADLEMFGQAFLLFSTNLVGIIVAAVLTFRLLGYSPAVKSRSGLGIVLLLLALITVPLYLSYQQIIETQTFELGWQEERFLVHGKYLIIRNARLSEYSNRDILTMDIVARELLTREDLAELKRKVSYNFADNLVIRANIIYIP